MMKKNHSYQILSKKYHSQYRQVRKIWSTQEYELVLLKNIVNKKKYICSKKYINQDNELFIMLKDVQNCCIMNQIKGINKFVGYSVCQSDNHKKSNFKSYFLIIYQYGQLSLDEFIKKNHRSFHKKQSITFVRKLIKSILSIYSSLEYLKGVELNSLYLDHQLILVNNYGEVNQQIKFCYFPMSFLKGHKLEQVNFHHYLYSARELRLINRQNTDRPQLPPKLEVNDVILQSERQTDNLSCNSQILQKIGLCVLKCFFLLCQEVQVEDNQFELYCMNEQFDVDFNWSLIDEYLAQCQQYRQYAEIGRQLRFMLRENSEEKYFQEYSDIIQGSKMRKKVESNLLCHSSPRKQQDSSYIKIRQPQQKSSSHKKQRFQMYLSKADSKLRQIVTLLAEKQTQIVEYEDGSKYEGQLIKNQREGLGVYTFAEGDIFAGTWSQDFMTGKGYYYFINGERYQGEVKGGVKEGQGSYYYRNGDYYIGTWHNDLKQGYGQFYCSQTQEIYKGNFHDNFKEGKGIILYPDGKRFQGHFSYGKKNGSGLFLDPEGRLFMKGTWKNDQIAESAEIFMANNDYYIGQVHECMKQGKGIYKYNDGTVCEGEFKEDRLTGMCIIRYANGDTYQGEVVNGVLQGRGKYYYHRQQLYYEGNWHNGKQHGQGVYCYKNKIRLQTQMLQKNLISFKLDTHKG